MARLRGLSKRQLIVCVSVVLGLTGSGVVLAYFIPIELSSNQLMARLTWQNDRSSERNRQVPKSQMDEMLVGDTVTKTGPSLEMKTEILLSVRNVLRHQTAMAQGEVAAGAHLKEAMSAVEEVAVQSDFHKLSVNECDALALYVLSGGRPQILERILRDVKLDTYRLSLFQGALAFVKGDLQSAEQKLTTVEASRFEPILAARIFLLQAQLESNASYENRRKMLESAANLALGTLFEEAATRRLVALAADHKNSPDLDYWADRYQRRFGNSLYFADFWNSVLNGIFAVEKQTGKTSSYFLHALAARLPVGRKVGFMQQFILRAIREGQPRLCQFGFEAMQDGPAISAEYREKIRLYQISCSIGTDFENVGSGIAVLDQSKLDNSEVGLLNAAQLLVKGIFVQTSESTQDPETHRPSPNYPGMEVVKSKYASVAQQFESTNGILNRAK